MEHDNDPKIEGLSNKKTSEPASKASHALRTPLIGIVGLTEHLLDMRPQPKQLEFLQIIYSYATEAVAIASDLPGLSDATRPEALDEERLATTCYGEAGEIKYYSAPGLRASPRVHRYQNTQKELGSIQNSEGLNETQKADILVLVVDDNVVSRQVLLRLVSKEGYSVHVLSNGKEALEYIHRCDSGSMKRPGIILMDVYMPVLDGIQAIRAIRTQPPFRDMTWLLELPIIAMTASAISDDVDKCLRAGADDVLFKPIKATFLGAVLGKWCTFEN